MSDGALLATCGILFIVLCVWKWLNYKHPEWEYYNYDEGDEYRANRWP
jgi:hypothetical protein